MVRAIIANASETKAVSDLGFSSAVENQQKKTPTLAELKGAIPPECFESSLSTSLLYLARDIVYASILVYLALRIDLIPSQAGRVVAWSLYMFAQGCVGTGVWIIGHECGHGAFSKYDKVNNFFGWLTHSALLVPYFSWKITHARHHRYTGHITKDAVFVPETEEELRAENTTRFNKLLEMAEETSIVTVLRLLQHQLIGWQLYLLFNLTAGKQSLPAGSESSSRRDRSHFTTTSSLFLPSQKILVVLSDLGLLCTLGALWLASQHLGYQKVMLLYFGPYLWVHHWLVAITYLHHTHPDVPYYTDEAWTFTQGAMGTIDRSIGFIGRHFFHEIIDFHVVHHLFSKIPFYHAEAATRAIQPLLGERYVDAKKESFLSSLYTTFKSCNYVAERRDAQNSQGNGRLFWVVKRE